MAKVPRNACLSALCAALSIACAAEPHGDEPADGGPACPAAAGEHSGPTPSFAAEVFPLFNGSCATFSCHDGATRSRGLFLGPSIAENAPTEATVREVYDSMLGPSTTAPELRRVKPGDPAQSFLMLKLDGCQAALGLDCPTSPSERPCGDRMPLSGVPWSRERRALVREWIRSGAVGPE